MKPKPPCCAECARKRLLLAEAAALLDSISADAANMRSDAKSLEGKIRRLLREEAP